MVFVGDYFEREKKTTQISKIPSELNLEMTLVDVLSSSSTMVPTSYMYTYVCIYVTYTRATHFVVCVFLHALLRDEKQKRSLERLTASPPPLPNNLPHSPHDRRLGSYAKIVQIF